MGEGGPLASEAVCAKDDSLGFGPLGAVRVWFDDALVKAALLPRPKPVDGCVALGP